jgi:hypothetical protein
MKTLILLTLLVGCSEKKNVLYQSEMYICKKAYTGNQTLKDCVNMLDMSEVKKIHNATNIIEIEVGK